jgi:hypothetical protein
MISKRYYERNKLRERRRKRLAMQRKRKAMRK